MKNLFVVLVLFMPFVARAGVVNTTPNLITEFNVWNEAEYTPSIDGDVMIITNTGLAECSSGVWIKHSQVSDRIISVALAAFMAKKEIYFQVWNDSGRYWPGSGGSYCQVRAVRIRN